jgi:actin-related protein 5
MSLGVEVQSHPLIVTEPMASPEFCRSNLYELLFECYQAPSVLVGVDSLFAAYENCAQQNKQCTTVLQTHFLSENNTQLILQIGHAATHIVPIVAGKVRYDCIKRVNVGSGNCSELL